MDKGIRPGRIVIFFVALALLAATYIAVLYKLQVVDGKAYYEASQNNIVTTQTVKAARGNILDRYGRVLVSNTSCNNLVIDTDELFDQADPNAVILRLTQAVTEYGDTYTDELPVTREAPFEYIPNMNAIQRTRLDAYIEANGLNKDADGNEKDVTAVELMAYFRSRYKIDNSYDSAQMRTIAGIRYELNIRYVINTSDYVFVENASLDLVTALMESDIPGFRVEVSYIREYKTTAAAQLLGYVGLMDEQDIATYSEQGYPLNAQVGQDGAELAFEEYLHGTDGEAAVTRTSTGTVTNTVYTKDPEPGNHVYLTIDIELQSAAEQALGEFIETENAARAAENATAAEADKRQLISGGSIAIVDVKSGEPLALVSYPTFDLSTMLENYEELSADTNGPLFNRALMGLYAPGSTFKPCTAITGLATGKIGLYDTITCTGTFSKYADSGYEPHCWVWPYGAHGDVAITQALSVSCNVFFYTLGDWLTIDPLREYAARFGLGEATGIELPEYTGNMAGPDYKASLYEEGAFDAQWFSGDTVAAAIGQSISQFTPLQIANYIATVANFGYRYSNSMLKSVSSYDYSEKVYSRTPEVLSTVDADREHWDAVHAGLSGVVNDPIGTAYGVFSYLPVTVAAKTGTAQTGEGNENTAVFVCYAPYEDPEIAIAVVVEKGASGKKLADIAGSIMEYYFSFSQSATEMENELSLLK